jgi:hypothetical protein
MRQDVKDLKSAFDLLEQRQFGFELRFSESVENLRNISNANLQLMSDVRKNFESIGAQYKELKLAVERAERFARSRASSHNLADASHEAARIAERALDKADEAKELVSESGQRALLEQRNALEQANRSLRLELNRKIQEDKTRDLERAKERRDEMRRWKWTLIGAVTSLFVALASSAALAVSAKGCAPSVGMVRQGP